MKKSIDNFDPHTEGALARFDNGFVKRFEPDSMLVRALSDLWTIALARMLRENDQIDHDKPPMLYSNEKAVDSVKELRKKNEALDRALFQEPFGFAPPGAIKEAFSQAFGPDLYDQWLAAFEQEDFDYCHTLITGQG